MSNPIQLLNPSKFSKHQNTTYLLNTESLKEKLNNLTLESYLLNNRKISSNNRVLIQGLIQNYKIPKFPIIIKLERDFEKIKDEYNTSKKLQEIGGFIEYIDLFECYNNTINVYNDKIYKNTNNNVKNPKQLCSLTDFNDKYKTSILVMPYYKNGSIYKYEWNLENSYLLKNLLGQVVNNCYKAYKRFGFIHKDLYFRNIVINDENNAIIMDMTEHSILQSNTKYNLTNNYKNNNHISFKLSIQGFLNELTTFTNSDEYKIHLSHSSLNNLSIILNKLIINPLTNELINELIVIINNIEIINKMTVEEEREYFMSLMMKK
jgi:hypothetical protein